jgi:O-antigen/teichoic acid export membrane protein
MAAGAAWMVFFKLSERSLGLISTVVLARLLIPADFGLVAMATSIIALLELMRAFGFEIVLIQNQQAERRHYDTAWTFNVCFGVALALILLFVASPAARFYAEPRLEIVIYFLGLGFCVEGFQNVGIVEFRKELRFKKEFAFLLTKKLFAFTVALAVAFAFRSYWALVAGIVTGRFAGVGLSYFMHAYRPRLSLAAWHELLNFSKWLLINNIAYFIHTRSADFIIGKLAGARALGLYAISYEISTLPTTELVAPINRAIFPGYSKIADDLSKLRASFLQVISVIALLALPAALGIAATAHLLVPVFLGNGWVDAIPLMQVLAFYGAVISLTANQGAVYLALAKPKVLTMLGLAHSVVLVSSLLLLTHRAGPLGAAWAFVGTALILLPVRYALLFHYLKLHLIDILGAMWRPLAAAVGMLATVNLLTGYLETPDQFSTQLAHLGLAVITGFAAYLTYLGILWRLSGHPEGAESILVRNILPVVRAKVPFWRSF